MMPITALKHLEAKKKNLACPYFASHALPPLAARPASASRLAGRPTGPRAETAWPRRDVIGQITHPFPDYLDNNMPLHDDQQTGHYLFDGIRTIVKVPNYSRNCHADFAMHET